MTPPKDPKDTAKLIKFFKTCISQIAEESGIAKAIVEHEIKQSAGFPFESCTSAKIEDMQNLLAWTFVYADQVGVEIDYPQDELDKQLDLNFKRTEL